MPQNTRENNDGKSRNSLGRIAWLYYEQDMSQKEIGEFLNMSRLKVVRALQEAKKQGIVKITIDCDDVRCFEIENELAGLTGLARVMVLPAGSSPIESVGGGAAARFAQALENCKSIALGGGRTISAMTRRVRKPAKQMTEQIISMGESLSPEALYDPSTIAHTLTTRLGVKFHQIGAPAMTAPPEVVELLKDSPAIAGAIAMATNADIAFTGVSAVESSEYVYYCSISDSMRRELLSAGVVGEIEGTFYTADGRRHDSIFSRCACVPFPMRCPVVLVAAGAEKVNAVTGAVHGAFVNELITDSDTAELLLEKFRA